MANEIPETTEKPVGLFYELSAKIGYAIGVGGFHEKQWVLSTGAQLSLLHSIAAMLGLNEAKNVIWPMVVERCDQDGICHPDHIERLDVINGKQ